MFAQSFIDQVFTAIASNMPSGSLACLRDQLTETSEFIFSPCPLEDSNMLSNLLRSQ